MLSVLNVIAIAALVEVAVYIAVVARTSPIHVPSTLIVALCVTLAPLVAGAFLATLREHTVPLTAAVLVSFIVMAVLVALLSATRIPISYFGILLCGAVLATSMILVELRLQKRMAERVAILAFPGAAAVQVLLRTRYPVLQPGEPLDWRTERVLIDFAAHHAPEWSSTLLKCYVREIEVTPWINFLEMRNGRVDLNHFDVTDVVFSLGQILYLRAKRLLDILLVLVTLPLFVPVGLLTWLYVRLKLTGGTIFQQERRGRAGSNFRIYKFRTMCDDKVALGMSAIRRFRLDEIPQLINILRGEMSWIGPRPVTVAIAETIEQVEPNYAGRQLVRPGLTGWAQVNAGYARTTVEEIGKLAYDLFYIKRVSLDLDIQILLRTVAVVLFGARRQP
ncbi:MAG: sugar transferase [Devosia sp.]